MAKTASPIAYGILGLLSGLGQGLIQHQEQERQNKKEDLKRQQDLEDIKNQQAFQAGQTDKTIKAADARAAADNKVQEDRIAEDRRHNQAVEKQTAEDTTREQKYNETIAGLKAENDKLALHLTAASSLIDLIRAGGKNGTPAEEAQKEARKFLLDQYGEHIKDPLLRNNPQKLKEVQNQDLVFAFSRLGTTGNPQTDKQFQDALAKTLLKEPPGNKGVANQNTPAPEQNYISTPSKFGQGLQGAFNFFNPFPDISGPQFDLADFLKAIAGVDSRPKYRLPTTEITPSKTLRTEK